MSTNFLLVRVVRGEDAYPAPYVTRQR